MSTASKTTTSKPKKSSANKKVPAPVPAESAVPAQSKPQSSHPPDVCAAYGEYATGVWP